MRIYFSSPLELVLGGAGSAGKMSAPTPIARNAMAKPSLICAGLPKKTTDEPSRAESIGAASGSVGAHSEIGGFRASMRNLLDKSSIAQSLDGTRLMGSLLFPGAVKLVRLAYSRKAHIRDRETSMPARSQRNVGELYRMVTPLLERGYVVNIDDRFHITTKLFEPLWRPSVAIKAHLADRLFC